MGIPVRIFLNSNSGSGSDASTQRDLQTLFDKHACLVTFTRLAKSLNPTALAQSDPPEMAYIAAGGDGTVNLVASTVAGTPRRMGVLPIGTLNHFAKDLNLPLELEPAVEVIAAGHTRKVDSAHVTPLSLPARTFVNNSSLGVYPAMVIDRERMKRSGRNKWASLVAASARAFVRFRCLTVEFEVDGRPRRCTTPFVFVGNNEYCLDGARLGEREHLDRGRLSLSLAPGATRITMLRLLTAALFGRLKQTSDFQFFQPTTFRVTSRHRALRVSLDGEVAHLATPLEYSIRPASLNVLCPTPETIP